MEIYVGNIPPTTQFQELGLLYQPFGTVVFVDIKNRCQPPFAFILFDNVKSAKNAASSTNGYQYQGHQLQVKLLTPDENCIKRKIREKSSASKNEKVPPLGQPGGLDDRFRKRLSGAGTKWYIRYLKKGFKPKEARIKAEEHKYLALGESSATARKKAEEQVALLFG